MAAADDVEALRAQDQQKGSCSGPATSFNGDWAHVVDCEGYQLEAGTCQWHNDISALDDCEQSRDDESNIGALAQELQGVSGGLVSMQVNPDANNAGATLLIADEDEYRRWMKHHGDATLARGLLRWSAVFHRNHPSTSMPACFFIADDSIVSDEASDWGLTYGADKDNVPIVAERCEAR